MLNKLTKGKWSKLDWKSLKQMVHWYFWGYYFRIPYCIQIQRWDRTDGVRKWKDWWIAIGGFACNDESFLFALLYVIMTHLRHDNGRFPFGNHMDAR